jgi:hexaprenyl-diphosphate synthase
MKTPSPRASLLSFRRTQLHSRCTDCLSTTRNPPKILPRVSGIHHSRRRLSTWAQAVSVATNVLSNATSRAASHGEITVDPLRIVAKEMNFLTGNIRQLLGSGHPTLDTVAKYYTQSEGKYVRPLIVLLMSRATALMQESPTRNLYSGTASIDDPISPTAILADVNPSTPTTNPLTHSLSSYPTSESDILPSQRRLAEITELIHTASLLHDDVIDHSEARRGSPSANLAFGNKMAVLAGDFLLGRASVALARLRNSEVIELLATVIANLVEGEFMQLKNTARDEKNPVWTEDTITYYLQKTYLKSASLISKSCRAAALLGGSDGVTVEAAYAYGKNLGLATAPLLFAWKQNQELGVLVGRKFSKNGDVERVGSIASTVPGQANSTEGSGTSPTKRRPGADTCFGTRLCRQSNRSHQ